MNNTIFLIEKAWIDPLENRNTSGYTPYRYTESEEEAIKFCEEQGHYTGKDCWSITIFNPEAIMPKFIYKPIQIL